MSHKTQVGIGKPIAKESSLDYIEDQILFFENRVEREWLTTSEAAKFLGISENALRIMVYRGHIQVYKFKRRLRFKFSDLKVLFTKKGA